MRDPLLDTAKAVLIYLVVLGHFLEYLIGWSAPNHVLLGTIYFIHMPAFIFISGVLFKDKNYHKNIIFFLTLYLLFQIIFPAFDMLWTGQFQFNWNVFAKPYWILWYLLGMMVWTVLTHFLIQTRMPILIAVLCSLLVGLSPWNNYQYSVGRIFVFFPFFVVGAVYGKQLLKFISQQRYTTLYAGVILLGIASVVYLSQISRFWLYGSYSYTQLKVDWIDGSLIRFGCLVLSSLGVYAVFALTRLFSGRLIQLGTHTLPVYLLHGFIVLLIAKYLKLQLNLSLEILICILLSIFSCALLQQRFFDVLIRKCASCLMKPIEKIRPKAFK